uniref:RING-type domain-containing protein n=1 Tax=Chelydra serpentina TaxID=8475 RepID=A0A8C3T725_CHESE
HQDPQKAPLNTMAAVNPLKSLRDEATCSICLSFYKDPVSLDCGHSFCRACIAQCWEGSDPAVSCPQCRETFPQRTLRPNRQLGNFALYKHTDRDIPWGHSQRLGPQLGVSRGWRWGWAGSQGLKLGPGAELG